MKALISLLVVTLLVISLYVPTSEDGVVRHVGDDHIDYGVTSVYWENQYAERPGDWGSLSTYDEVTIGDTVVSNIWGYHWCIAR